MTDDEIDTRLRAHGTAWREANHDRPAIDWEVVTKRRRTRVWFAVAGVCVAVIAIVVPLVLTTGDNSAGTPVPPIHPSPSPSPTSAKAGAPPGFFALKGNRIAFVTWTGGHSTIRPAGGTAESLGVAADDKTAYAVVTTLAGSMLLLNGHGGVGSVVGTNFPWVDSVSSDPTGQHLLLASGPRTFRWDNGKLTRVPGQWGQPGW